jgi:uncharacterized protein HemX
MCCTGGNDAAKIEPSRVGAAYRLALAGEQGVAALEEAFVQVRVFAPSSGSGSKLAPIAIAAAAAAAIGSSTWRQQQQMPVAQHSTFLTFISTEYKYMHVSSLC